jgi:hypothetical protein
LVVAHKGRIAGAAIKYDALQRESMDAARMFPVLHGEDQLDGNVTSTMGEYMQKHSIRVFLWVTGIRSQYPANGFPCWLQTIPNDGEGANSNIDHASRYKENGGVGE